MSPATAKSGHVEPCSLKRDAGPVKWDVWMRKK
jgi:hypothetical protein